MKEPYGEGNPVISLRSFMGGKFVVCMEGEAYDVRAKGPNRRFRFEAMKPK